jgi:hypothetical protein
VASEDAQRRFLMGLLLQLLRESYQLKFFVDS